MTEIPMPSPPEPPSPPVEGQREQGPFDEVPAGTASPHDGEEPGGKEPQPAAGAEETGDVSESAPEAAAASVSSLADQLRDDQEEEEEEEPNAGERNRLSPSFNAAIDLILSRYATDPYLVAQQLGKNLNQPGYNPADDEDVKRVIQQHKEALKEKPKLQNAVENVIQPAKKAVRTANAEIKRTNATSKAAEDILGRYADPDGNIYRAVGEDGSITEQTVSLSEAIMPVLTELETISNEKKPEPAGSESTEDAILARRCNKLLNEALITDGTGCHLDREKLVQAERRETLADAQVFLNTEFARIFLEKEIVSPDPTIMTLIQLAKHVDLSHEYARQIVYAGLRLAEQQRKLTPSKAAIQQTKEVLAKHLQKVAAVPVREEEPEAFIRRLAQDDIGFGVDYWIGALNKALQAAEKGEDTSLMMYTLLTDYINAAKQQYARDSGSSSFVKMKEMFESMVPEEKREGLFRVAIIKEEIKTQCPDEYKDFIQGEKDGEKVLENKIEAGILFTDDEESYGPKLFMMLYGLMMLSQIFQSADAEAAAAGAQQQGRGG